jgi:DNA-3-methyladenine glycosylase I
MKRCPWGDSHPLYITYHDEEWGVPVHDDRRHFEFLVLEGAQAGLSWLTILKKRESYRKAYDQFDPRLVAKYGEKKRRELLSNEGIIRNQKKIEASIQNAKRFLEVQREFGSFDRYIWDFVDGRSVVNRWKELSEIPAKTILSDAISKDLIKRGFKFVGSTIVYSYLQATGLINDHLMSCFRYRELVSPLKPPREPKHKSP